MPQIFKIGSYWVFFWANESDPLEPIHVHVCEGAPNANATKIWITKAGKCYLCHNNSRIAERTLRNIMKIIEARSAEVIQKWRDFFGEVRYYNTATRTTAICHILYRLVYTACKNIHYFLLIIIIANLIK